MNESDDEDVDWGEPERQARMFDNLAQAIAQMGNKQYVPVCLRKLAAGMRFDVRTVCDEHDTMEFTLLEPETRKVRVSDNFYFPEPTECVLIGSQDDLDGNGAMIPGAVKRNAKLVIEVGGQRLKENGPELRIMHLTLHLPNRAPFSPWTD